MPRRGVLERPDKLEVEHHLPAHFRQRHRRPIPMRIRLLSLAPVLPRHLQPQLLHVIQRLKRRGPAPEKLQNRLLHRLRAGRRRGVHQIPHRPVEVQPAALPGTISRDRDVPDPRRAA
eukprot:CAMPEP_0174904572 /NCGR_PEP_ID=MMETSP0167-20121228/49323_1 /TAXON_ID=38298 /ORGANISM="Rhodella maculata, Strain CCMP736" /LENGTH=117 /DNA_ID=CAMNT_0016147261 /DNA_START=456 /DNA_END=806 /DNA_ORIENTATION=+